MTWISVLRKSLKTCGLMEETQFPSSLTWLWIKNKFLTLQEQIVFVKLFGSCRITVQQICLLLLRQVLGPECFPCHTSQSSTLLGSCYSLQRRHFTDGLLQLSEDRDKGSNRRQQIFKEEERSRQTEGRERAG